MTTSKKNHSLVIKRKTTDTNGENPENKVKKKITMEQIHGTIKADNIFGGITYSKEKQIVSHDEAIYSEPMRNTDKQEDKKSVDEDKYSTTNLCYAS